MSIESESSPTVRKRPLKLKIHTALRWLHVYLSMFSMLVVLFFSVTGITLNHPEWKFGNRETRTEVKGQLPQGWTTPRGPDWLKIADYLRDQHRVHGAVADRREEGSEGAISFKASGYAADCFFDLRSGAYRLEVLAQGPVGVLNDLHKGRDSGGTWSVLIDLSGVLLTAVSLTGIGLLLYLKKMRLSGFVTLVMGCAVLLVLIKLAT